MFHGAGYHYHEANEIEELGLEGFSDIIGWLSARLKDIRSLVGGTLARALNTYVDGDLVAPKSPNVFMQKIAQAKWADVAKLQAFRPEHLNEYLIDYAGECNTQLTFLSAAILERQQETIKWLAKVLSDFDHAQRPWRAKPTKVDDLHKATKKMFKVKKVTERGAAKTKMGEVFATAKAVEQTHEIMLELSRTLQTLDLKKVKENEDTIALYIDKLVEDLSNEDLMLDMPKPAIKQLMAQIDALTKEVEYFSVLVFSSNVTIDAFNKSVDSGIEAMSR